jgi:hypothetical protein
MKNLKEIAERVMEIAKANPDGFTIDRDLNMVSNGFAVAGQVTQHSFGEAGLAHVLAIVFGQDAEKFDGIGGWHNKSNGAYYFDAVRIFDDQDDAQNYGEINRQIAYYDLSTGAEHYITYEYVIPMVKIEYSEFLFSVRAANVREAEQIAIKKAESSPITFIHKNTEIKIC